MRSILVTLHDPVPALRAAGREGQLPLLRDGELPHAARRRVARRPVLGPLPDHPLALARLRARATRCSPIWETRAGLLAGLALIALGAGGIKPCVSAFVGDQFGPTQKHADRRGSTAGSTGSINLGSASANAAHPVAPRSATGPSVAFAIPGVLMALALVVFWAGTTPLRAGAALRARTRTASCGSSATRRAPARHGPRRASTGSTRARDVHPAGGGRGREGGASGSSAVFAAVTLFWALFDQKASSWVLQASQMDLVVARLGDVAGAAPGGEPVPRA